MLRLPDLSDGVYFFRSKEEYFTFHYMDKEKWKKFPLENLGWHYKEYISAADFDEFMSKIEWLFRNAILTNFREPIYAMRKIDGHWSVEYICQWTIDSMSNEELIKSHDYWIPAKDFNKAFKHFVE